MDETKRDNGRWQKHITMDGKSGHQQQVYLKSAAHAIDKQCGLSVNACVFLSMLLWSEFVVIGSSAGKTREEIMAIYPRHKAFAEQFIARGDVVGIGPFTDPGGGNMALFRSREAAEAFAKSDPFFLEGAVKEYQIKEWGDNMLS